MTGWKLIYEGWDPSQEPLREALCTLGNGYFATRGALEMMGAGGVHYPGTYMAGGYDRLRSTIADREIENEDLVNWPNWLSMNFRPEGGDWFDSAAVEMLEYRQELDLAVGLLQRTMRFRDGDGRETKLVSRRFVHMAEMHYAAMEWTLTPENWSGKVDLRSALEGRVQNAGVARYRKLNSQHLQPVRAEVFGEDGIALLVETVQSRIEMAQAARTRIVGSSRDAAQRISQELPGYVEQTLSVEVERGKPLQVEKIVAIYSSRDWAISSPENEAKRAIERAGNFAELLRTHRLAWERLWYRCDIQLEGVPDEQLALRVHIFHILQTVSLNTVDLDAGLPARGLHGEAYRGHVFWDELYIFPYLQFRVPEIARALQMYRYRRLPEARRIAKQEGFSGALFPWQSGSDGREETQVVHLNPRSGRWVPDETRLQRHVNAAIAFNVWRHYQATGRREFICTYGSRIILEIARFWASAATFNPRRDRYEIHGVVGPDEYHTRYPDSEEPGLNNNAYTNVMAAWVLQCGGRVVKLLDDDCKSEIFEDLQMTDDEIAEWSEIGRKMYVPFQNGGIISQFEGYEKLQEFDWESYRAKYGDIHRLDRILEAEGDTPNRYKVSKQADVLMLFYLFTAERLVQMFEWMGYSFDPEWIPKNIEYYLPRTSHGSTLSAIVNAWVQARSDRESSWRWFERAVRADLRDVQGGTTAEGIHLGAMAGTVDLIQRCYSGIAVRDDVLWLNPGLPEELKSVTSRIQYRGHWFKLHITSEQMTVLFEGVWEPYARLGVDGKIVEFKPGETREFDLTV
ncbi:MAG: glycosyl hydrolase family 65 protein [Gemmatimonadales bacterium]|jgi:trehalose/maltose hydrolase-like predicted phosphorylase